MYYCKSMENKSCHTETKTIEINNFVEANAKNNFAKFQLYPPYSFWWFFFSLKFRLWVTMRSSQSERFGQKYMFSRRPIKELFWKPFVKILHMFAIFEPSWLVVMATKRLNFWRKQINSSEAIWGIKLKLFRNVHSTSLYKTIVFFCCCLSTLVAMATSSFHRLIIW